jgi:hypothetical protein
MATHRIPILGFGTVPDASGEVFFEPYSVKDTGTVLDPLVLIFNDSGTVDGVRGSFTVPENYVGSPVLKIYWTANATSGTTQWDWSILVSGSTDDMGAAAARTSETASDTKTGTAFALEIVSITLTAGDYTAGEIATFELFRDTVTDSMAAAAIVFAVNFEYADA